MNKSSKSIAIATVFGLFFIVAFVTGLQNPMGIVVKSQFNSSNFLSQLGNFANFIAYAFMGIPSGVILRRLGYRKTALISVVVGFFGVFTMYLSGQFESFLLYLFGAFVCGFSMCMINTIANPMLNTLGGEDKGGNGLLQFAGVVSSTGATVSPIFLGYLIGDASRGSISSVSVALFFAMAIFAFAFLVLLFVPISEPSTSDASRPSISDILSHKHFSFGLIAIFAYVGLEVGIASIANLYMTSQLSFSAQLAGSVVGTYWFLMLCGRFLGGVLSPYFSSRSMLIFVCFLGIVFLSVAMLFPYSVEVSTFVVESDLSFSLVGLPLSVALFALCGLCTSVMWGNIFNLSTSGLGTGKEVASGIFMTMVCGGGVLPALQGLISDRFGYLTSYLLPLFCFAYILLFALFCKSK